MDIVREELAEMVRWAAGRGWTPATGGNFSARNSSEDLQFWVTPSGIDKGLTTPHQLILVDSNAKPVESGRKPSDEALLHAPIYELTEAKFVAHTHTVHNTLASLAQGSTFSISGLEMVKALRGNRTHEMTEYVPILENSQDIASLAKLLKANLLEFPNCHGILLRGHGLYTWGSDIFETKRHLEAFEFLFEVTLRATR